MLFDAVVFALREPVPSATLLEPVVFEAKALVPNTELLLPVVLLPLLPEPIETFCVPEVFASKAPAVTPVNPQPIPTLKLFVVAFKALKPIPTLPEPVEFEANELAPSDVL